MPDYSVLQELGVARLSLGPGLLKHALRAMRDVSRKLLAGEGLDDITGNDLSSAYVKSQVNKSVSGA